MKMLLKHGQFFIRANSTRRWTDR